MEAMALAIRVQMPNKSVELTPYMRHGCCSAAPAATTPHSSRSSLLALGLYPPTFCTEPRSKHHS
jgi:hypothetical protein